MLNHWTGPLDLVLPDAENLANIEASLWARQDLSEVSTIARLSPSAPPPITWGGRITKQGDASRAADSPPWRPTQNAEVQFPDGTSSLVDLQADGTLVGSGAPPAVLQHGLSVA
jgi:hypothetical protein